MTVLTLYLAVRGPGSELLGVIPGLQFAALHRFVFLLPLLLAVLAALAANEPRLPVVAVLVSSSLLGAAVLLVVYANPVQTREHWPETEGELFRAAGLVALIFILLLARAWAPNSRRLVEGGMVLLVFADLFSFGHRFNPVGSIAALTPPTPMVDFLRAQAGLQRVAAYQTHDQLLFGPNVLSIYGLAEAGGYSSVMPGRFPRLVAVADPKREASGIGRYLRSNGNIALFDRPSCAYWIFWGSDT